MPPLGSPRALPPDFLVRLRLLLRRPGPRLCWPGTFRGAGRCPCWRPCPWGRQPHSLPRTRHTEMSHRRRRGRRRRAPGSSPLLWGRTHVRAQSSVPDGAGGEAEDRRWTCLPKRGRGHVCPRAARRCPHGGCPFAAGSTGLTGPHAGGALLSARTPRRLPLGVRVSSGPRKRGGQGGGTGRDARLGSGPETRESPGSSVWENRPRLCRVLTWDLLPSGHVLSEPRWPPGDLPGACPSP